MGICILLSDKMSVCSFLFLVLTNLKHHFQSVLELRKLPSIGINFNLYPLFPTR